jgi:hypothetical protein
MYTHYYIAIKKIKADINSLEMHYQQQPAKMSNQHFLDPATAFVYAIKAP